MNDRMLDGNAAGGLLAEVFASDITAASATCAHCGATGQVGALHAYTDAPGVILRCPGCQEAVARLVRSDARVWLDLRGAQVLEFALPPSPTLD